MSTFLVVGRTALAAVLLSALAPPRAQAGMPAFVQDVSPEAVPAVKVVDAFSAAIKAARIDSAKQLLDPNVLVLESGGSERSRDQYLEEHAVADAAYMQGTTQELRYRKARVAGDLAWVGTESILTSKKSGKPSLNMSTETMILHKTADGWKIVHIHWSSRAVPEQHDR